MHEMSIATSLVEQLERIARQRRMTRVVEVEVRCGVLQQIVPDALELAFQAASAGSVAAGATLRVIEHPLLVRCRRCGREFSAAIDNYLCAACSAADVDILEGRDIVLQSIVGEAEKEAPE